MAQNRIALAMVLCTFAAAIHAAPPANPEVIIISPGVRNAKTGRLEPAGLPSFRRGATVNGMTMPLDDQGGHGFELTVIRGSATASGRCEDRSPAPGVSAHAST